MTHTSHKVSVGGRHGDLILRKDSHIAAKTGSAGGGGNHAARVDEGIDVAELDAFLIDLLGRGDHDTAQIGSDVLSLQDLCRRLHVGEASVGAGADDHLVGNDLGKLLCQGRVSGRWGQATVGSMADRSMTYSSSYSASASAV